MPGSGLVGVSFDAERSPGLGPSAPGLWGGFTRIFLPFVGRGGVMALVGLVGVRNPESCQAPWQGVRRRSRKEREELHGFHGNKSVCKDQRTSLTGKEEKHARVFWGILVIQGESLERKW